MDPSENAYDISLKDGNKFINRFCIDEDAAFELSGVHYLKKWANEADNRSEVNTSKGKENPRVQGIDVIRMIFRTTVFVREKILCTRTKT